MTKRIDPPKQRGRLPAPILGTFPVVPPPPPKTRSSRPPKVVRVTESVLPDGFPPAEKPTGKTNKELSVYQSMLSVYDQLPDPLKFEIVELARSFAGLNAEDRRLVLEFTSRLATR